MPLSDHRAVLAPHGHLRVAINLGNPVLAQGDARSPRGPSVSQAHPGHRVLADRFTAIQQAVAAPAARPADALQALFAEVEAIKQGPLLGEAFARAGQAVTLVR